MPNPTEREFPMCHFTPMTYEVSDTDSDGHGGEEWFECKHCGHTKAVDEVMRAAASMGV